jgi:hypothetical protein
VTASAPVRASGRTPADEAAAAEMKGLDQPVQLDGEPVDGGLTGGAVSRPENRRLSLTPAFSRMRTDWNGPDRDVMRDMHRGVDTVIQNAFGDLIDIISEIHELVRTPLVDTETGEMVTDGYGLPKWERVPGTNSYQEDWSRIGHKEREELIFKLTTGLFAWGRTRDRIYAEALFARAQMEEAFAHGFEFLPGERPTIDDRTARARVLSAEYRYHAVYASYLSRRADTMVRNAELFAQRLKDLLTQ